MNDQVCVSLVIMNTECAHPLKEVSECWDFGVSHLGVTPWRRRA